MTDLVGYRTLRKRDFRASRIGAFGTVKRQKVLLPRKGLNRSFFVGSADNWFLDMEIVAGGHEAIRNAVSIEWSFTNSFGKSLKISTEEYTNYLFADPVEFSSPQRVWVKRPKDAVFAVAKICRLIKGVKIGLSAKLKLQKSQASPNGEQERLSRDRATLGKLLVQATEEKRYSDTSDILARMVYLWRMPEDRRLLETCIDARKLVERGFKIPVPKQPYKAEHQIWDYAQSLSGDSSSDGLLSRWLLSEVLMLTAYARQNKIKTITIKGNGTLARRTLALSLAQKACGGAFEIQRNPEMPLVEIEPVSQFISREEVQSYL
ncbi:hypothetical protein KFE96_07050 [Kordiimonas sp. SCSIO 12603]|uniref:hypothetical protein n=1 Tax=Kordiimonas sp. SCSIO 12603 TaxID=2829596 RepID=UPI00210405E6|nr:hypothetical protein [Kordiimonas sp. SCSIO 12603]UTW60060.1 hypothetical protein KFE96_07050 [Kordiimonas sp. SCSIO 12603]